VGKLNDNEEIASAGFTRRLFLRVGAGATIAAAFLPDLMVRGIGFAAQDPTSPSAKPATN